MNWIWMTMVMAFLTMMTSLMLMETASRIAMKLIPMVMAFQMIKVYWNVSWPGFLPFLKMMMTMTDTILQDRPKIVAKPTKHSL